MLLAGVVLALSLVPISCAKAQLNESTRNEGLLAEIPLQLNGYFIFI